MKYETTIIFKFDVQSKTDFIFAAQSLQASLLRAAFGGGKDHPFGYR